MGQKVRKRTALRNAEYYDQQELFDSLYSRSKNNEVFGHLMDIITSPENIKLAYRNIKRNDGSETAGTDGMTIAYFSNMGEKQFVDFIQRRFANYHPKAVRRVEIPKPNGKMRPLGIPCMTDRIIQQCVLQVLEPICEAKFYEHSYGFRPNRSAENAIAYLENRMFIGNLYYVVDVDIKGFFDNVNHKKLLRQLWTLGIRDTKLLQIIKAMLKAPIRLPDGTTVFPDKGTPQGGILSPLLANVVLNELDWWIASQWELFSDHMKKHYKPKFNTKGVRDLSYEYGVMRKTNLKEMHIVRYADDFKIICANRNDAERAMSAVKDWLRTRLKLEVSEEKSKVTNVKRHYSDFLGFKIKVRKKAGKWVDQVHMCDKAVTSAKKKIREAVRFIQDSGTGREQFRRIAAYNSLIIGLHNYYRIASCACLDFEKIGYDTGSTKKIRLSGLKREGQIHNSYIAQNYGSSKQMRWLNGEPVIPAAYVRYRRPNRKKQSINKYTPEGRQEIHKKLGVDTGVMVWMMRHPVARESVEFNDNRISLFAGQLGKCAITGEYLTRGDVICRRKVPKWDGGTSEYSNLILVTQAVDDMLNEKDAEFAWELSRRLKLDENKRKKANRLRVAAGLSPMIQGSRYSNNLTNVGASRG